MVEGVTHCMINRSRHPDKCDGLQLELCALDTGAPDYSNPHSTNLQAFPIPHCSTVLQFPVAMLCYRSAAHLVARAARTEETGDRVHDAIAARQLLDTCLSKLGFEPVTSITLDQELNWDPTASVRMAVVIQSANALLLQDEVHWPAHESEAMLGWSTAAFQSDEAVPYLLPRIDTAPRKRLYLPRLVPPEGPQRQLWSAESVARIATAAKQLWDVAQCRATTGWPEPEREQVTLTH